MPKRLARRSGLERIEAAQRSRGARLRGAGARAGRARRAAAGRAAGRAATPPSSPPAPGSAMAMLHNVDGTFVPFASEGGHADFAARTPRELDLVRELTRVFGRVDVEHIVSGPGPGQHLPVHASAFGTGPTITPNSIAPARLCAGVGTNRHDTDLAAPHLRVRARRPLPAVRRGARDVPRRPTDRRPATSRCARWPRPGLRRRRHRAEDPAGRSKTGLPRRVPRERTDGGSDRDDSRVGHHSIPTRVCSDAAVHDAAERCWSGR